MLLCLSCFASLHCFLVVTWRERGDLLALVCDIYCDFVTFPFGILGQVWYLIVWIPDPCCFSYFEPNLNVPTNIPGQFTLFRHYTQGPKTRIRTLPIRHNNFPSFFFVVNTLDLRTSEPVRCLRCLCAMTDQFAHRLNIHEKKYKQSSNFRIRHSIVWAMVCHKTNKMSVRKTKTQIRMGTGFTFVHFTRRFKQRITLTQNVNFT